MLSPAPRSRNRSLAAEDLFALLISGGLVLGICLGIGLGKGIGKAGWLVVQAFRHHPGHDLLRASLGSMLGTWLLALLTLGVSDGQPIWLSIAGVLAGLGVVAMVVLLCVAMSLEHRYQATPPAPPPDVPVERTLPYPWWITT
jgi:hypothetical protein